MSDVVFFKMAASICVNDAILDSLNSAKYFCLDSLNGTKFFVLDSLNGAKYLFAGYIKWRQAFYKCRYSGFSKWRQVFVKMSIFWILQKGAKCFCRYSGCRTRGPATGIACSTSSRICRARWRWTSIQHGVSLIDFLL